MEDERQNDAEGRAPFLRAYRTSPSGMRLIPAPASRAWMNETTDSFANRCLPLKVANQAGWFVLNDRAFEATWDGGKEKASVRVEYADGAGEERPLATSHFGHGILTFHVPYLFRTPPGYNTLARGPANWPKDGACALEGLVETDWLVGSFTMNWKLTRPGLPVLFEKDEPVCMVVPRSAGNSKSSHRR